VKSRTILVLALAPFIACCGDRGSPYEQGIAAYNAGDVRTARVQFLNALQADPNHVEARIMQARVELALGDGVAAQSEIGRSRQAGASVAATRHLFAHARLLQGDPRGAIDEAQNVPAEHAAYAARIRGQALAALGDGAAAQAELDRAIALAPDDGRNWAAVARFRRDHGDLAGAIHAADRAVAAAPRTVETLLIRGELTRSQYGLAAALPWFDRALEVDPGNVTVRLERAITYGDMGRMQEMLADTRAVLRDSAGHPTAYYLQAVLAARARNFRLARSIYNRTNGRFATAPAGMLLASAIDFETGNVEQAAVRLEALLARQPGNRKARRLLAAAQWRGGDARGVAETLAPLVARPDADSYSLTLMGRALLRLGQSDAAALYLARAARPFPEARSAVTVLSDGEFAALQRAAAASPGDGPLQLRLVSALLARGFHADALARARRLQAANPGAPQVHLLVGDALGIAGDFRAAAEQYRRAANLAFNEETALRLIEALHRSGQEPAANNVLALFVRENPRNVPGQVLLGSARMREADWPGAIEVYEGLRSRIGDNDATILNNLAWAYSEIGDHGLAIPLARRAWSLDRDNPATADTLGWILFKSGQDRAAGMALLERAARGAPTDYQIRERLERARRG
jgi:putative PEP-CTERM system TPR-repeat lipoprotein